MIAATLCGLVVFGLLAIGIRAACTAHDDDRSAR